MVLIFSNASFARFHWHIKYICYFPICRCNCFLFNQRYFLPWFLFDKRWETLFKTLLFTVTIFGSKFSDCDIRRYRGFTPKCLIFGVARITQKIVTYCSNLTTQFRYGSIVFSVTLWLFFFHKKCIKIWSVLYFCKMLAYCALIYGVEKRWVLKYFRELTSWRLLTRVPWNIKLRFMNFTIEYQVKLYEFYPGRPSCFLWILP